MYTLPAQVKHSGHTYKYTQGRAQPSPHFQNPTQPVKNGSNVEMKTSSMYLSKCHIFFLHHINNATYFNQISFNLFSQQQVILWAVSPVLTLLSQKNRAKMLWYSLLLVSHHNSLKNSSYLIQAAKCRLLHVHTMWSECNFLVEHL